MMNVKHLCAVNGTGKDVDVHVLDTGIRTTHKDFQGRATSVFNVINDGNLLHLIQQTLAGGILKPLALRLSTEEAIGL